MRVCLCVQDREERERERKRVRVWRGGCLCASESRRAGEGQLEEWIPLKLMGEGRGSGEVGERGDKGRDQYLSNVERGGGWRGGQGAGAMPTSQNGREREESESR